MVKKATKTKIHKDGSITFGSDIIPALRKIQDQQIKSFESMLEDHSPQANMARAMLDQTMPGGAAEFEKMIRQQLKRMKKTRL